MRTRLTRTPILAIVALVAVMATTADAQARTGRTRSPTRIPVTKEPPAPDSTARRDSTLVTMPAPAPAPTPEPAAYEYKSEPAAPRMRRRHFGNGFYAGIGGGAGIPTGPIHNAYNTGFAVQV